jgi:hypothetical protein
LGELRTLAAEIHRDSHRGAEVSRVANCNYRLRVLTNRHALSARRVAELAGVTEARVRSWRTNPASVGYRAMSEIEYARFEAALNHWLETTAP